jgi:hypothetical protein
MALCNKEIGAQPPMDLGLTMVSRRAYAETAVTMGLSPLAYRIVCQDRVIGWRTNRWAYIHPEVFRVLFGRYPMGYQCVNLPGKDVKGPLSRWQRLP